MKAGIPIGLKVSIISRVFRKKMDERAHAMDLTSAQLHILGEINRLEASGEREINQRDLEEIVHVTHPTMTGILKRLESKGFVQCIPSPRDKRYKKITCTEQVAGIYEKLVAQDEAVLAEMCRGFSKKQMDDFVHMIDLILKNGEQ